MLKVLVIGGISLVLGSLVVLFWAYFMYLWRTWDSKRDPSSMYDAAQAEYDEEFEKVRRWAGAGEKATVISLTNILQAAVPLIIRSPLDEMRMKVKMLK